MNKSYLILISIYILMSAAKSIQSLGYSIIKNSAQVVRRNATLRKKLHLPAGENLLKAKKIHNSNQLYPVGRHLLKVAVKAASVSMDVTLVPLLFPLNRCFSVGLLWHPFTSFQQTIYRATRSLQISLHQKLFLRINCKFVVCCISPVVSIIKLYSFLCFG